MIRTSLHQNWTLQMGQAPSGARNHAPVVSVTLPHDFLLDTAPRPDAPGGPATGYYGGDVGVYETYIEVPAEWEGQSILVEFDGVMARAEVYLNGQLLTFHPNGYTPFIVDLTRYLYYGSQNRLQVVANISAQPDSRWYTGGGIYRPVTLLRGDARHIAPWGIFAYTKQISAAEADVGVEISVVNDSAEPCALRAEVTVGDAASISTMLSIDANATASETLTLTIPNPRLWDIDDPQLYPLTVALYEGSQLIDTETISFGIRTIEVNSKKGLLLNGRSIKLKGGCIHHTNGILGAMSFAECEERKIRLHKENGYNAVRSSHNAPSRSMLDACDRLGILVIDEFFDCWNMPKVTNDYHLYFAAYWRQDITEIVLRDRNHPSVLFWSTGNEIPERAGLANGYAVAKELADFTRELDPTRPVTNGVCSLWNGLEDRIRQKQADEVRALEEKGGSVQNMSTPFLDGLFAELTDPFCASLDVAGYNYMEGRYELDGQRVPDRVICGTESFPTEIDRIWAIVEKNPHVIGDFTWTSFDYIGEAGIGKSVFADPDASVEMLESHTSEFPWRLANDADLDICGFDRPQLHYRQIVWGDPQTYLMVHDPKGNGRKEIVSRWGWPQGYHHWNWSGHENETMRLSVYSRGDQVELLVNGVSLGIAVPERYTAHFETAYVPGTVEAISYCNGRELSRDRIMTTGVADHIRISFESPSLVADQQSLVYATVEIVDQLERRVLDAEVFAAARVFGAGTLLAFGSAAPKTMECYTSGAFTSHDGRWQAILRSDGTAGAVTLHVEADGFEAVEKTIPVLQL